MYQSTHPIPISFCRVKGMPHVIGGKTGTHNTGHKISKKRDKMAVAARQQNTAREVLQLYTDTKGVSPVLRHKCRQATETITSSPKRNGEMTKDHKTKKTEKKREP